MKKPALAPGSPPSSTGWSQNSGEQRRTTLVIKALRHVCSCAWAGLSRADKQRLARLLTRFEKRGTQLDAPRSGRPIIYTDEKMEAAVQKLIQYKQGYLTTPQLVSKLVKAGKLHKPVDLPTFRAHLKAYVKKMGHQLIMSYTHTTFFLMKQDLMARVIYCTNMQSWLAQHQLHELVFVDETQLAAAPAPKGELQGRAAGLIKAVHSHVPTLQAACSALWLPCRTWPCWHLTLTCPLTLRT
ncbi:MAG: hypothetical protein ING21_07390 [Burkholderiales bacterium]|jgi:hypothetical protein|nr:hypothetical protein [Burkholderiales bacterium]